MNQHFIGKRRAFVVALCLGLLVVALGALTASAANITVTPGSPQGWASTGNSGGGSSAITTTMPRSGDGSVELTGDRTRWIKIVDPLAPASLGDLYDVTDLAYDWMVAVGSTSNLGADYTPALRLHVYDPNATNKYSELVWEGAYNGPVVVTQGGWVSTDVTGGSQLLWRWVTGPGTTLDGGGAQVNQTVSAWQNAAWYSSDAVVYGISVGIGSSVGAGYHAFADNVVLGFSNAPDTFNFEPNPQCSAVCYADAVGGNDANDGITAATAKKTIQAAIDEVDAGGQVRVLPGSYSETAVGRDVLGAGSYQFGLFFEETAKDGVTLMGVTAADVEITDPGATEAVITTNATNNFGYAGIFVEADNVTISGLEIGANTPVGQQDHRGDRRRLHVQEFVHERRRRWLALFRRLALRRRHRYVLHAELRDRQQYLQRRHQRGHHQRRGLRAARRRTDRSRITSSSSHAMYTASGNSSWPYVSFTGDSTTVPWFTYPMSWGNDQRQHLQQHGPQRYPHSCSRHRRRLDLRLGIVLERQHVQQGGHRRP